MKNTGIARRVDNLGRIVLPKEIRSRLRIHEDDLLEIYIDDGKVVLMKLSPLEELSELRHMLNGFWNTLKCPIMVCDREKMILFVHPPIEIQEDISITPELAALIENRKAVVYTGESELIQPIEDVLYHALVVQPIVTAGCDLYGAVVLLSAKSTQQADERMTLGSKMMADAIAEYLNS